MATQSVVEALGDRGIRWTATASVVLLALIAAVVSFGHMHELVLRHGESRWNAVLIPFSVDGMVVASSMSVLRASRLKNRAGWLPWTLLIVGSLASVTANIAVAEANLVGRLIAAWPSFAFVGAYHLLQGQLRALPWRRPVEDGQSTDIDERYKADVPTNEACEGARSRLKSGGQLQRQAWQWAQTNRLDNGSLPSGEAIARRFDRSPRWGRLVKRSGLSGCLENPLNRDCEPAD